MKRHITLLAAMFVALCASATDLYVIGTMNGWVNGDAKFKMKETVPDKEWTFAFNINLVDQNFKINDGSWTGSVNLGLGETPLLEKTAVALVSESNKNIKIDDKYNSATRVVITLKKDSKGNYTLKTNGVFTVGKREMPALYLRSESEKVWDANNNNKFVKDASKDRWTLTTNINTATFTTFKIADINWGDYNFGGSDALSGIVLGKKYQLTNNSNNNMFLDDALDSGLYTFTVTKEDDVWNLVVTR